jgi:hypothetical protein
MRSLQLLDFSDRDLLYALEESYDDDGWAMSRDVARKIGIDHANPANCVGSRFAWLKRFGVLTSKKTRNGDVLWQINEMGAALLHARDLNQSAQRLLDNLSEGQRMQVTEVIAGQVARESRSAALLSSRAWRHHLGPMRVNGAKR